MLLGDPQDPLRTPCSALALALHWAVQDAPAQGSFLMNQKVCNPSDLCNNFLQLITASWAALRSPALNDTRPHYKTSLTC